MACQISRDPGPIVRPISTIRRFPRALGVVPLVVAALALAACGSGTPQAGPASSSPNTGSTATTNPASSTTSTSTTSTTSVSPIATSSAIDACNADAQSVVTAVESYDAVKGTWPTSPGQLVGPDRYLRTWPNNPSFYAISLGANGAVDVTPAPGTPGHAVGTQDYSTYDLPGVGNICATL